MTAPSLAANPLRSAGAGGIGSIGVTTARTGAAAGAPAPRLDADSAERPVVFDCQGERLLGILHPAGGDTGVVVIVGGPQYRAGSHRLFVQLARTLAAAGHPVLRFDVRGMGDSSGAQRSFEDISPDIGAAIDTLMQQQPQVRRVVLWGLCDGASAALLYLHDRADERVKGLCLLNPWVRSDASLARTQVKHYYVQRLLQRGFWSKLLRGGVGWRALQAFWRSLAATAGAGGGEDAARPGFQQRMARQWAGFDGQLLLLLSDADYTAREFEECLRTQPDWRGALQLKGLEAAPIEAADHTLSTHPAATQMNELVLTWLRAHFDEKG